MLPVVWVSALLLVAKYSPQLVLSPNGDLHLLTSSRIQRAIPGSPPISSLIRLKSGRYAALSAGTVLLLKREHHRIEVADQSSCGAEFMVPNRTGVELYVGSTCIGTIRDQHGKAVTRLTRPNPKQAPFGGITRLSDASSDSALVTNLDSFLDTQFSALYRVQNCKLIKIMDGTPNLYILDAWRAAGEIYAITTDGIGRVRSDGVSHLVPFSRPPIATAIGSTYVGVLFEDRVELWRRNMRSTEPSKVVTVPRSPTPTGVFVVRHQFLVTTDSGGVIQVPTPARTKR